MLLLLHNTFYARKYIHCDGGNHYDNDDGGDGG